MAGAAATTLCCFLAMLMLLATTPATAGTPHPLDYHLALLN